MVDTRLALRRAISRDGGHNRDHPHLPHKPPPALKLAMTLPAHTPYDGSSRPFSVGLRPLDLAAWIEIDDTFDEQMREKRRLFATIRDDVFVEEPDTIDAQREVLDLIRQHLTINFPDRFRQTCKGI